MTVTSVTSGQTPVDPTIGAGDSYDVYSSGTIISAQVDAGGTDVVFLGGAVVSTTVSGGGMEVISLGGVATGTVVSSGGSQTVDLGGTATSDTLSGGTAIVTSGGSLVDAVVSAGGTDIISSGGAATGTVVSAGGLENVGADGTASATVVQSGGVQMVGSGATASVTQVLSFGQQIVASGGIASGTVLNGLLAVATVSAGGTLDAPQVVDGYLFVSSGVVSDAVLTDASVTVYAGGTLVDANEATGTNIVTISSGGVATGMTVADGNALFLEGATATATQLGSGGQLYVFRGGDTLLDTVASGGEEIVTSGTAQQTHVESGGFVIVSGTGALLDPTLDSGSELLVLPGATTTLPVGTQASIYQTGVVLVSRFSVVSSSEGTTSNLPLTAYDRTVYVLPGGEVVDTLFSGITGVYSGGIVSASTVTEYGILDVYSGGQVLATELQGLIEMSGGTASGITADAEDSGLIMYGGTAIGTVLRATTVLNASGTAVTIGTTVSSGGTEYVLSGAVASGTVVSTGGRQILGLDGTTTSTMISSGGSQVVASDGVATSSFVAAGGFLLLSGTSGGGTASAATIANSGMLSVQRGGRALGTVIESGGTLAFLSATTVTDSTLAGAGKLDITDFVFSGNVAPSFNAATDTLSLVEGGDAYTQQLSGNYAHGIFSARSDGAHGTDITVSFIVPCYCRGTRLLTEHGEVAVEALRIGDPMIVQDGTVRPVRWIGTRAYDGRFISGRQDLLPVVILAGALADGMPARDLRVSPLHALLVDGVLIPARRLLNGRSIVQPDIVDDTLTYFHVELESHDILLAEGTPAESFVDCDSRGMFQNADEFAALYPDDHPADRAQKWNFCAPRHEGGAIVAAVRRRLAGRAGLAVDHADDAAEIGALDGCIDVASVAGVSGWARDVGRAHTPVTLALAVDGVFVLQIVANIFRDDLRQAGKGTGHCAFAVSFPTPFDDGADHVVTLHRVSDGASLTMSPVALRDAGAAAPEGFVDACTRHGVHGWAFDPAPDAAPIVVTIFVDGAIAGQVTADAYRRDLAQAGKRGGACAFAFRFARPLSGSHAHVIDVRRPDGGSLTGAPAGLAAVQAVAV